MNYVSDYRLFCIWYPSISTSHVITQSSHTSPFLCSAPKTIFNLITCLPLFFSLQFKTTKAIPFGVKVFMYIDHTLIFPRSLSLSIYISYIYKISIKVKGTKISWYYWVRGQSSRISKIC